MIFKIICSESSTKMHLLFQQAVDEIMIGMYHLLRLGVNFNIEKSDAVNCFIEISEKRTCMLQDFIHF